MVITVGAGVSFKPIKDYDYIEVYLWWSKNYNRTHKIINKKKLL